MDPARYSHQGSAMKSRSSFLVTLGTLTALGACGEKVVESDGAGVAINVAPLTLPGVSDVCYTLEVQNDVAETVWSLEHVCASRYGDGVGDISYVGTCDATDNDAPPNGTALNTVTLTIENIYTADVDPLDYAANAVADDQWDNPCGKYRSASQYGDEVDGNPGLAGSQNADGHGPCQLVVDCIENRDMPVVFNINIMRDADQGFFDVAVNFEDIFCSMKIDTCYDGQKPIELLFDDAGERAPTAVLAAACSAGTDDANTVMWMAPLVVSCSGGVSFVIDPTGDTDGDAGTPGIAGNHSVLVDAPAANATTGTRSTGTLRFTAVAPVSAVDIAVPQGILVSRNGIEYLTEAPGVIAPGVGWVEVPGIAVGAGVGSNFAGPEALLSIVLPDAGGVDRDIAIAGRDFVGGVDPDVAVGTMTEVGYGLYWGAEQLRCQPGNVPCNKEYWSVAINLGDLRDAGLENCQVTTAVTASSSTSDLQFVNGGLAGPGQTYAFVDFEAYVTDGQARPTCFQGPMGSAYAAPKYGNSSDMSGGNPFPLLCSTFVQGADSPTALGDAPGYFSDPASSPERAYVGSLAATGSLTLEFNRMGGAALASPCQTNVANLTEAVYFDGAGGLSEFSWRGAGSVGAYSVHIYRRNAREPWALAGGFYFDLSTELGRLYFGQGAVLRTRGDTDFAFVVTRMDAGVPARDLRILIDD